MLSLYDSNSSKYIFADYLIKHFAEINKIKLIDIIKAAKLSKSTIARLIKKLGCSDIQYLLNLENNQNTNHYQHNELNLFLL